MRLKNYIHQYKAVFKNITALAAIQGTNFVLPLLTIPYVIMTVGEVKFGIITFAQSFFSYLLYLVDYGFNITTTREISLRKEDKNHISHVVSDVLSVKILLLVIAFVLLLILVYFVPMFQKDAKMYYLGFLLVLGQAFVPLWFYQGIEKMQYLTYANVFGKAFFTVLIFILIKSPADYVYVLPLYAMGNLISGFLGVYWMFGKFEISWKTPTKATIIYQLQSNWYPFVANFSINSYISANVIILRLVTNNEVLVGYYSIADRIINALKQLLVVFFQATYPMACRVAQKSHQELLDFFKKMAFPFCFTVLLGSIGLFFFSDKITILLTKKYTQEVSYLIKMLSVTLVIVSLNIPAYQTLLAYNYQKSYLKVFIICSLLNVMLNFVFTSIWSIYGTALAVILTEIFITAGLYIALRISNYKHKII